MHSHPLRGRRLLGASVAAAAAMGTGEVRPEPRDRNSDASIRSAVDRARDAAVPLAVADARRRAVAFGFAAGLRVGGVISITEPQPNPFSGPFGQDRGTFGPGRFCGEVPRYRTERDASGRIVRRVRIGTRRTCRVPARVTLSLMVTYAATPAA
jgi:hypothetical protein